MWLRQTIYRSDSCSARTLHTMDREDVQRPPSPKRSRAATYGTKFNLEWNAHFPFISNGHQDPVYSFYCGVCQKDVSCRHQGIADVKRHVKSSSHSCNASIVRTNSSLTSMGFVPVGSAIDTQVKFIMLESFNYMIEFLSFNTDKES